MNPALRRSFVLHRQAERDALIRDHKEQIAGIDAELEGKERTIWAWATPARAVSIAAAPAADKAIPRARWCAENAALMRRVGYRGWLLRLLKALVEPSGATEDPRRAVAVDARFVGRAPAQPLEEWLALNVELLSKQRSGTDKWILMFLRGLAGELGDEIAVDDPPEPETAAATAPAPDPATFSEVGSDGKVAMTVPMSRRDADRLRAAAAKAGLTVDDFVERALGRERALEYKEHLAWFAAHPDAQIRRERMADLEHGGIGLSLILNPCTVLGPLPRALSDLAPPDPAAEAAWIEANAALIAEKGAEWWLPRLLFCLLRRAGQEMGVATVLDGERPDDRDATVDPCGSVALHPVLFDDEAQPAIVEQAKWLEGNAALIATMGPERWLRAMAHGLRLGFPAPEDDPVEKAKDSILGILKDTDPDIAKSVITSLLADEKAKAAARQGLRRDMAVAEAAAMLGPRTPAEGPLLQPVFRDLLGRLASSLEDADVPLAEVSRYGAVPEFVSQVRALRADLGAMAEDQYWQVLGLMRHVAAGEREFRLAPPLARSLLLTEVKGVDCADLRMPFGAIVIRLPAGLVDLDLPAGGDGAPGRYPLRAVIVSECRWHEGRAPHGDARHEDPATDAAVTEASAVARAAEWSPVPPPPDADLTVDAAFFRAATEQWELTLCHFDVSSQGFPAGTRGFELMARRPGAPTAIRMPRAVAQEAARAVGVSSATWRSLAVFGMSGFSAESRIVADSTTAAWFVPLRDGTDLAEAVEAPCLSPDLVVGPVAERMRAAAADAKGADALRAATRLVLNALLYISLPNADVRVEGAEALARLREQARKHPKGSRKRKRADKALQQALRHPTVHHVGWAIKIPGVIQQAAGQEGTAAGRSFTASWLVRGHWRQQAVGVGRKEHKRIWIMPQVRRRDLGARLAGAGPHYEVS